MRVMLLIVAALTLLCSYGCERADPVSDEEEGLEIRAPGVEIKIDKEHGLDVKAPGTAVHADKESGVHVKAPGVDVEAQGLQNDVRDRSDSQSSSDRLRTGRRPNGFAA